MRLKSRTENDVLVLMPMARRIEAASTAEFKGQVVDWVGQGHTRIVLDLSNVEFIDSSGLGAIISSLKSVGENGIFYLSGVQKPVMKLFKLTRMDRVFRIFGTTEEALANF